MIPKKVTLPKQKKFHDSKFLFFFFNYCIYQGWGGSIAIRSSQFFLEFFSLSLGIQYTLYMDVKFHKRDAVAIYKKLDKDNFSWLIHSYIKIEYKFVRKTAVHVYWESWTKIFCLTNSVENTFLLSPNKWSQWSQWSQWSHWSHYQKL